MIQNHHPKFAEFLEDWEMLRDSYRGERVVKEAGEKYLPATSGMVMDGMLNAEAPGFKAYQAYKTRAVFPEYIKDAVQTYMGLLWQKPPTIELPPQMESMRERATTKGEGLEGFLRRINEQQLVVGRCGIMADLPVVTDPLNPNQLPYLALYNAETIINWDEGTDPTKPTALNLVVLNETGPQRVSTYTWHVKPRWRVLLLGDPNANELSGVYSVGVVDDISASDIPSTLITPSFRGNLLQRIPFVMINSKDIVAAPEEPPLLGLARLAMAIYRGEADYRQNLFMQGQDTLVVIGALLEGDDGKPVRTGAGSRIDLPVGGDAKYIGVTSQGLAEQRQALAADRMEARTKAGQLVDPTAKQKESGDALETRLAAQTATLNRIAMTGAAGLQNLLRIVAEWIGADPEKVLVEPNTQFTEDSITSTELKDLVTAKTLGLPLSNESIHNMLANDGYTTKTFEEELAAIDSEDPTLGMRGAPIDTGTGKVGGGNGGAGGSGQPKRVGPRGA